LNNHTKSQLQDKTKHEQEENNTGRAANQGKTTAGSPKKNGVLADQLQQYEKLSAAEIETH
jgi:hypothetical protein